MHRNKIHIYYYYYTCFTQFKANRQFPSSPQFLFQSDSNCKTFFIVIIIYSTFTRSDVILYSDTLWNLSWSEFENHAYWICILFSTLIIYMEKFLHFWLSKSSAIFFKTVQKRVNSVQKEVTNQAFWLVNDQRNS